MKDKLEDILNSIKEIGRNAKKHWKKVAVAIALPFITGYETNAATFEIHNYSSSAYQMSSFMRFKTAEGNQEGHGPEDALFNEGQPGLKIFSEPNDLKYSIDGRPLQTPGVDMHLKVKGEITGPLDNSLWIKVTDASGLEHRKASVYDVNAPETVYDVNTTPGEWTEITLPDIVNKKNEIYTTWHIAAPTLVPGDIASAEGIGKLDGKRDMYDLGAFTNGWLTETYEGENFSWGDVNYDGVNNMLDFATIANSN
jgi:hypothetical protein